MDIVGFAGHVVFVLLFSSVVKDESIHKQMSMFQ